MHFLEQFVFQSLSSNVSFSKIYIYTFATDFI